MKRNNKNQKNQNQEIKLDTHFIERFKMRFQDFDLTQVEEIIKRSKRYTTKNIDSVPFPVVKKKLQNPMYSDSVYYVNPKFNMVFVVVKNIVETVLYLDGRDGYNLSY